MNTENLGILKISPTDMFADETFNAVLDDIDIKVVGVSHLISGAHWDTRKADTSYSRGEVVRWPRLKNHQYAECIVSGTTGSAETLNNNITGDIISDGTVTWRVWSLTEQNDSNGGIIKIWMSGYEYKKGDAAYYGKSLYRCITAHTATTFSADLYKWQEVYASIRPHMSSIYYVIGDTVLYNDLIYICKTDHLSTTFQSDISNWELVCDVNLLHDWEQSKTYYVDSIVNYNGQIYRAVTEHTSSSVDFASDISNWELVTSSIPSWNSNVYFARGNIVHYGNVVYICSVSHTSTSTFDYTKWHILHDPTAFIYDWVASKYYYVGQVVRYAGILYRCNTANSDSSFDIDKWVVLTNAIEDWVSGNYYVPGQYVNYQGKLYKCLTSNYDIFFTSANWQKVSGGVDNWSANIIYAVGDVVINAGKIYQCNTAHTSQSTFNADSAKWAEISACITRIPNWETSKDYVVGDLVAHDAKIYRCTTAHTSDSTAWNSTEESKWEELSPTINEISIWSVSTDYEIGQLVIYDNKLYRCNTDHTSDNSSFVIDITYWDEIGSSGIEEWETGKEYTQGSMVVYNDKIYVCDSSHTSANLFDFTKWHEVSSTTIEDWKENTEYVENQPIEYNDMLFRANKDFTSGTTVSDDDNNLDFVYANLSTWQSGVYYRQGAIVIDSDDKIYKCKQSHTSSSANRHTNWEELSKTLVDEYAQNKNYAEGAPVLYNGKLYRANTNVTNSTAVLDLNKWDNIVGSGIEQWQPSTDYSVGNVVVNNNQIYICTTAHTSDSTAFNTDIANWGLLDTKWKSENWSANTLYTTNEVVLYDNRLFRCVSTHISAVDFVTDANYWLAIGSRLEVWKQNVHYKVEDVIINNNKLYRCITEHTSTTTFDGTKWNEISPAIIELWQTSTDYIVGNLVIKDNQIYRCKTAHTSDASDFYADIANWDILDTRWRASDWVTGTKYFEDEVVIYDDTLYRCNTTHTSLGTFELDKSSWDILNANIRKWISSTSYKTGDLVEYGERLYRCQSNTSANVFKNSEWKEVSKCNIELWRSAPNADYLGIFKFDQDGDPFYNTVETSYFGLNGSVSISSGKYGKSLAIVGTYFSTDNLTFTNGNEVYTVEFWYYVQNGNPMADPKFYYLTNEVSGSRIDIYSYHFNFASGSTSSSIASDVWNHIVFIIDSDNIELFINGVSDGVYQRNNAGGDIALGAQSNNIDSRKSIIDELYISVGAKYTSDFNIDEWYPSDYNVYGYKTNDLVVYADKIYRALEDNNDVEFNYSKWVEISSANTLLWESNIYYAVGDIVIYDGQTYRCITAHTSNTFLGDIANWQSLATNWLVNDWGVNKLYLENQVISYADGLWKCLETHESMSNDIPINAMLYESTNNTIEVDDTTTIPYSEVIDLGSIQKITDFSYNEVTTDMSFTYNIETSTDGVTYTPWTATKTNARYVKLTVYSVNIATGATSPSAYLDDFAVVGESDKWEKISSGGADIELARRSEIDDMFI